MGNDETFTFALAAISVFVLAVRNRSRTQKVG